MPQILKECILFSAEIYEEVQYHVVIGYKVVVAKITVIQLFLVNLSFDGFEFSDLVFISFFNFLCFI